MRSLEALLKGCSCFVEVLGLSLPLIFGVVQQSDHWLALLELIEVCQGIPFSGHSLLKWLMTQVGIRLRQDAHVLVTKVLRIRLTNHLLTLRDNFSILLAYASCLLRFLDLNGLHKIQRKLFIALHTVFVVLVHMIRIQVKEFKHLAQHTLELLDWSLLHTFLVRCVFFFYCDGLLRSVWDQRLIDSLLSPIEGGEDWSLLLSWLKREAAICISSFILLNNSSSGLCNFVRGRCNQTWGRYRWSPKVVLLDLPILLPHIEFPKDAVDAFSSLIHFEGLLILQTDCLLFNKRVADVDCLRLMHFRNVLAHLVDWTLLQTNDFTNMIVITSCDCWANA